MKKLCILTVLLIALCLPMMALANDAPVAPAAQAATLSTAELLQWRDLLWQQVRDEPVLNRPEDTFDPDGNATYLIQLQKYTIESREPTLNTDVNPILSITLNDMEALAPRGLGLGTSLAELLTVYPNNNPSLTGAQEFATLYVYDLNERADAPEASWGLLMRDARGALSVEYVACQPMVEADAYTECGISYIIGDGYVTDLRVYGFGDSILDGELRESIQTVQNIAASTAYNPQADLPPPMHAEIFGREDLVFSGLDFLTETVEDVRTLLGAPKGEERVSGDGGGDTLRMTYPGLEFEFALDAQGKPGTLLSLLITDPNFEGPRRLRVEEGLTDVLSHFRLEEEGTYQEPQTILYAPGESIAQPPFGLLEVYSDLEATVRYAMAVPDSADGEAIMLHITVEGMKATEVLLYRWKVAQ